MGRWSPELCFRTKVSCHAASSSRFVVEGFLSSPFVSSLLAGSADFVSALAFSFFAGAPSVAAGLLSVLLSLLSLSLSSSSLSLSLSLAPSMACVGGVCAPACFCSGAAGGSFSVSAEKMRSNLTRAARHRTLLAGFPIF
jgi:hypothetical protein